MEGLGQLVVPLEMRAHVGEHAVVKESQLGIGHRPYLNHKIGDDPHILPLPRRRTDLDKLPQEQKHEAQHALPHAIMQRFREERVFDERPESRKNRRALSLLVHEPIELDVVRVLGLRVEVPLHKELRECTYQ